MQVACRRADPNIEQKRSDAEGKEKRKTKEIHGESAEQTLVVCFAGVTEETVSHNAYGAPCGTAQRSASCQDDRPKS
jgi:hypothetical protein